MTRVAHTSGLVWCMVVGAAVHSSAECRERMRPNRGETITMCLTSWLICGTASVEVNSTRRAVGSA